MDPSIKVLTIKFNLKCSIDLLHNKPRIFIWAESKETLILLIKKYIHPSMLYKLG